MTENFMDPISLFQASAVRDERKKEGKREKKRGRTPTTESLEQAMAPF